MTRTGILMGRMHKMENYISKMTNLKDGVVFGGELTPEWKEKFRSQRFRDYADAKIEKAKMLKLKIALAVYEEI